MKKLELLYINKKQNKTTITKKKTKCKEKEKKKKKRREEKKKWVLPRIERGTFRTPCHFVTTRPRETHCEKVDNILLKAFSQ